ncbi:MAG: N-acetylneuraminate synthase family protein [Bacteroidetes bacterium]|nr:N-acetylneuraminate synthase family protein [Bacteroidota bacterium]
MIYNILEVANSHGGNFDYLLSLIEEFSEYKGYGMKFQPLHPDMLSTEDYEGYPIYKELMFTPEQWEKILSKANETKEIWLDLFDLYGVEVFVKNRDVVKGIKFQSSVLYNDVLLNELSKHKLKNINLVINVSGYEIEQIQERINSLNERLEPKEILLEVGFQAYPTSLLDSGFVKIQTLKNIFPNRIVFADHAAGESEDSIWLPVVAALNGADVIEKHIKHSSLETKYDHFSAIDIDRYRKFTANLENYLDLKNRPFINEKEKEYLRNSIQVPICKSGLEAGQLINTSTDLDFKRSGKPGLNALQIKELVESFHILAVPKKAGDTFLKEDFKKATIAIIIACRLKSARLPKKALQKIGNLPSVQKCIKSCLNISSINHVILATSTLEEDAELKDHTYRSDVIFHKGDPDDVIQRYLDIADKLHIDVIIRVTADSPFTSQEFADYLLHEHFNSGADYTAAVKSALGADVEVINTQALHKVKNHFKRADYSEYMTWYFQNNPEHFKLHITNLPEEWVRDYRLTLDYPEDLELFNKIDAELSKEDPEYGTKEVIALLDRTDLSKINQHITQRYVVDKELIDTLNEVTKIK